MKRNRILGLVSAVCLLVQMLASVAFATSEIPRLTFGEAAITETVVGDGYTIDGTALTITAAGTYRIDGNCANGSIEVAKSLTDVTLILDGLTLTSSTTAPIILKKTSNVTLHIENTVTLTNSEDPANETSEDTTVAEAFEGAAIKAKSGSTVTFCGSGKLVVNGNAKNGIKGAATSTLTFADSRTSYEIVALNNGIGADGSVVIHGGTFYIEAENDGIKSVPEETDADSVGSVEIYDGSFDLTVNGDGIQADRLLSIEGGDFTIQTFGGYEVNGTKYYNVSNGLDKDTAGTFDGDTMSCKALKASGDRTDITNELLVTGGTFHINSADDAVHSDAYATVTGGTFHIYTGDDGMHADTSLTIGEENGLERDPEIYVYACFEGLEAGTVYLYNGRQWLNALDDGINAGGGSDSTTEGTTNDSFKPGGTSGRPGSNTGKSSSSTDTSSYAIYVYGGNVYVNCDGDGLDSNGSLYLYGGELDVLSQASGGDNAPIDCDGSGTINGATLFAAGTNSMNEGLANNSQRYYTSTTSANADTVVNVTSGSTVLHSITLTKKVNYMLYSAPEVTSKPTFATGGSLDGCASTAWAHDWNAGAEVDGIITYTCSECNGTEQQTVAVAETAQCDDVHTYTTEETEADEGFAIAFATDSGVAGIDVYYTQDYTAASETDVTAAVSRNSDTGEPDSSGSGQLNFLIRLEEGYTLSSVTADANYKNVKDVSDDTNPNTYRITKITGDVTVTITTEASFVVDINADGETDAADITALLRYLNGNDNTIDVVAADVNGDGKLSLADALRLMKLLAA